MESFFKLMVKRGPICLLFHFLAKCFKTFECSCCCKLLISRAIASTKSSTFKNDLFCSLKSNPVLRLFPSLSVRIPSFCSFGQFLTTLAHRYTPPKFPVFIKNQRLLLRISTLYRNPMFPLCFFKEILRRFFITLMISSTFAPIPKNNLSNSGHLWPLLRSAFTFQPCLEKVFFNIIFSTF